MLLLQGLDAFTSTQVQLKLDRLKGIAPDIDGLDISNVYYVELASAYRTTSMID